MSRQPKRKKSRTKHARPNFSGRSKAGGDRLINAHPKTNTKTALRDSDSDDSLRLDQMGKKQSSKELGGKKTGKNPRRSIGQNSWDDGCNSDDSSSSSEEVKKRSNIAKLRNQSNIKKLAAQPSRRESKHKSRNGDGNISSSNSESDRSVEEVKKKGNSIKKPNKNPPTINQSNSQNLAAQSSKYKMQKPKSIKRSSLSKINKSAGLKDHNTPYNAPSQGIVKLAETKVNRATIPEDITSISQLQWYRIRLIQTKERVRETLKPCRVLSRGEAAEHQRDNRKSNVNGKTTVIQYLTFPDVDNGIYKCVDGSLLVQFGFTSKDGSSTTFNDDYLQRYLQQEVKITSASNLEATRLFLKRVFQHARDTEKNSRDQANKDLKDYYDDSNSDDDGDDDSDDPSLKVANSNRVQFEVVENTDHDGEADNNEMEDLDLPYTQAITFDPDDFGTIEEQSNEPIRPGDVIEYYSPIYVAGDARGLRQASVLTVDPDEDTPLTLSNGEGIPSNIKVKRVKVMLDGELVDHPGIFRSIYRFKLVRKGSATAADAIAMEASRFSRVMQKNIIKLKERAQADGFAPMDLLVNMKGAKTGTTVKAPSKTKSSTAVSSRGQQFESLLSSSSDHSDDSSSNDDNKKAKQKVKPQRKKTHETNAREIRISDNKEDNDTASGKGKRMSLGSLSSTASLGSSLASSDDSSIESIPVKLRRNHNEMTQYEKSASSKGKKANKKCQDGKFTLDLCLSSDDGDDEPPKKMVRDKRKNPPKADSSSALCPSNSSIDSESSLETPNSSGLRKKTASKKFSPTSSIKASIGSSKRRLKLGTTTPPPKAASPSLIFGNNKDKKDSTRKAQGRKKTVPSSSEPSSKSSRQPIRKPAKVIAEKKSSTHLSKHPSPTDSVQIVKGGKYKLMTKKRSSPSSGLFSSDESDSSCQSKLNQTYSHKIKKPLLCEQSSDSSGSTKHNYVSKNGKESVRELPNARQEGISSSGWRQGKAGWEKKSAFGGFSPSGFSAISRHK